MRNWLKMHASQGIFTPEMGKDDELTFFPLPGALQVRPAAPVSRLRVVAARQEPRSRRRLRRRHHRAVQRRVLPCHLHRPHGARRQELQQG